MRVSLFLNHACNLRCTYCYNGAKFDRRMPLETALRGLDLVLAGGAGGRSSSRLSFFGGEPLLEMDLIRRTVDAAEERPAGAAGSDLRFSIVTNGTLLTSDVIDYLIAHWFYIGVSLDGCRAAHDATRPFPDGRPSYDLVADNLARLLQRPDGVGVKVVSVIDPANVAHLAESFDALVDLGARNLSLNVNYEADWTERDRERFEVALRQLGERYVASFRAGEPVSLNLLDSKIVTHLKGGYALTDRCDFGCEEVAVAPSGRLYPCDRLVGQDDRDDVVIGHVDTGVDRARRDALIAAKNLVLDDCQGCDLLHRCMHWCGCINHAMTGSVGEVAGLLCWFEQRLVEEADRIASVLHGERDELFLRRFYAPALRGSRLE